MYIPRVCQKILCSKMDEFKTKGFNAVYIWVSVVKRLLSVSSLYAELWVVGSNPASVFVRVVT
jgi:hypothetical protein